jgi:hypothetical protein
MHGSLAPIAILVLALGFAGAATAQKKGPTSGLWGAIAYSTKTGAYGYAVDYANKRAAETEAFRICGTNCDLVRSFRNGCAAVATREKRVASDTGSSREIAQAKALKKCGDRCKIAVWACTK